MVWHDCCKRSVTLTETLCQSRSSELMQNPRCFVHLLCRWSCLALRILHLSLCQVSTHPIHLLCLSSIWVFWCHWPSSLREMMACLDPSQIFNRLHFLLKCCWCHHSCWRSYRPSSLQTPPKVCFDLHWLAFKIVHLHLFRCFLGCQQWMRPSIDGCHQLPSRLASHTDFHTAVAKSAMPDFLAYCSTMTHHLYRVIADLAFVVSS